MMAFTFAWHVTSNVQVMVWNKHRQWDNTEQSRRLTDAVVTQTAPNCWQYNGCTVGQFTSAPHCWTLWGSSSPAANLSKVVLVWLLFGCLQSSNHTKTSKALIIHKGADTGLDYQPCWPHYVLGHSTPHTHRSPKHSTPDINTRNDHTGSVYLGRLLTGNGYKYLKFPNSYEYN